MSDLSDAVGIVVLFVSFGVGGPSLVLLRGNARFSEILSAFAQVTLLPERRRRFLELLGIEAACFLATGVLFGLDDLGLAFSQDPDLLIEVAFLAGMIALGALVWIGLSPRVLTDRERVAAEKDAPTVLESLWLVPYRRANEDPARGENVGRGAYPRSPRDPGVRHGTGDSSNEDPEDRRPPP